MPTPSRDPWLVEELRCELAEARLQLTATAALLRVISSSPRDLQRGFVKFNDSGEVRVTAEAVHGHGDLNQLEVLRHG